MSSSSCTTSTPSSCSFSKFSSMVSGRLPTGSTRLEGLRFPSRMEALGSSASGITAARTFAANASAFSPVAARKLGGVLPLVAMTTGGFSLNPKRWAKVRFPFLVSMGCQQCTRATRTPRGRRTSAAASKTRGGLVALLLVTHDTNQAVPPKKMSFTWSESSAGTKRTRGSTHSLAVRKNAAMGGPVITTKKNILSQARQRCKFAGSSSKSRLILAYSSSKVLSESLISRGSKLQAEPHGPQGPQPAALS
mmetsp:Transcript_24122/g.39299  ORF Transcript_24122/g.39299 Transcript_24122/m.39299 type:complete len:250 (-) Transcript_24122:286-1035(-)